MTRRNCHRCGQDFSPENVERVCPACRAPAAIPKRSRPISQREKQVIELVAEGKLNKEIGFALHLTEGTIKEYLNEIFKKLNVTNRTELAVWYLRHPEPTK